MSTYGYENCVAGTFYGFTKTEFNPGGTLNLQWGAIDNGATPLNITLGRAGGYIIDEIIVGAEFTTDSALYQLVVNNTANCTLEEYSWAIPDDFNTTDPQYQIGLFNASVLLGADGNALFGWQAWSPDFYVRPVSTTTTGATSTATTVAASATGDNTIITTSATSVPSSSASPSSSAADNNTSNAETIGIGVGVGVGAAALAGVLLGVFYLLRRRKKAPNSPQSLGSARQQCIQELPATEKRPPMYELAG